MSPGAATRSRPTRSISSISCGAPRGRRWQNRRERRSTFFDEAARGGHASAPNHPPLIEATLEHAVKRTRLLFHREVRSEAETRVRNPNRKFQRHAASAFDSTRQLDDETKSRGGDARDRAGIDRVRPAVLRQVKQLNCCRPASHSTSRADECLAFRHVIAHVRALSDERAMAPIAAIVSTVLAVSGARRAAPWPL